MVIIKFVAAVRNAILFEPTDLIMFDKTHLFKKYMSDMRMAASIIKIEDCIITDTGNLSGIRAEFRNVLA